MTTNQRPCAHQRWHHQAPEHEQHRKNSTHGRPCKHLTQQHGPTQSNEMNPKTNHDPAYPEGAKACPKTKHAYTWHTGQIPPSISHCFIAIIYIDRRFTRQSQVPTWILDSRQVSTSFPLLHYGCIRPRPRIAHRIITHPSKTSPLAIIDSQYK